MMHAVFETALFKMHSLPLSPFIAFLPSCSRFSPGGWILMIWPRWRDAGWKAGGRAARSIRAIIPFAFATCQCRPPAGAECMQQARQGQGRFARHPWDMGVEEMSPILPRLVWAEQKALLVLIVLSCLPCKLSVCCNLPQVSPSLFNLS